MDRLESWRTHERFTVIDAGNGEIALHCKAHNRFLRMMHDGSFDAFGGQKDANALPPRHESGAERFLVKQCANGQIALFGACNRRFVRCVPGGTNSDWNGCGGRRANVDDLPEAWDSERLIVVLHSEI
jgi:hypothetical protein